MADSKRTFWQALTGQTPEAPKQTNRYQVPTGLVPQSINYSLANHAGEKAFTLETVYACTARISQSVAALDLDSYKMGKAGRDKTNHNLTNLLSRQPNAKSTAFDFWEDIISDSLLWGTGYALIHREGNKVTALEYIPASAVHEVTRSGNTYYKVSYTTDNGPGHNHVSPSDMFVVSGFRGMNVFQVHRDTLDLASYSREFGVDYFRRGGSMGGFVSSPMVMNDDQYHNFQQRWNATHAGMQGHHTTALLDAGMTYTRLSIPPNEAQFLEARKYTDQAIARIFQVPAALIGLDTNVTFSNVEQQNIFFATYTIHPLVKRIENEIYSKLLTEAEKRHTTIEFDMSSLLRADAQTRGGYYQTLTNLGAMTINEVREKEGLNPLAGGDTPLVQMNQIPLTSMEDYAAGFTQEDAPEDGVEDDKVEEGTDA